MLTLIYRCGLIRPMRWGVLAGLFLLTACNIKISSSTPVTVEVNAQPVAISTGVVNNEPTPAAGVLQPFSNQPEPLPKVKPTSGGLLFTDSFEKPTRTVFYPATTFKQYTALTPTVVSQLSAQLTGTVNLNFALVHSGVEGQNSWQLYQTTPDPAFNTPLYMEDYMAYTLALTPTQVVASAQRLYVGLAYKVDQTIMLTDSSPTTLQAWIDLLKTQLPQPDKLGTRLARLLITESFADGTSRTLLIVFPRRNDNKTFDIAPDNPYCPVNCIECGTWVWCWLIS